MTQSTQSPAPGQPGEADLALAVAAAEAAAAVLPASTPLSAVGPQAGTEHVTSLFAGASLARLTTADGSEHRLAVLVGSDLVNALAESPLGGLDLASATQPAIDAAAAVLESQAGTALTVDLAMVVGDMGGDFTAVPLVGDGIDAAILLSDSVLGRIPGITVEVTATVPAAPPASQADGGPLEAAPVPPVAAAAPAAAPAASPVMPPVMPAPLPPVTQHLVAPVASGPPGVVPTGRGIEMLAGVEMEVTVELGRTRMPVRDLLALSPGAVLELDRTADGPADLLVNGRLIARGEVVVVDENFGLRITEIVDDSGA